MNEIIATYQEYYFGMVMLNFYLVYTFTTVAIDETETKLSRTFGAIFSSLFMVFYWYVSYNTFS